MSKKKYPFTDTRIRLRNVKKKEKAKERQERKLKILKIIEEKGWAEVPAPTELARIFNVSYDVIAKDLKEIRKEMPQQEDPYLLGETLRKFSKSALKALGNIEEELKKAEDHKSRKDVILAQMQIIKNRIDLMLKLGILKPADEEEKKLPRRFAILWEE